MPFRHAGCPELHTSGGLLHCYGTQTNVSVVTSPAPRHTALQTYVAKIGNNPAGVLGTTPFWSISSGDYLVFGWGQRFDDLTNDTSFEFGRLTTGSGASAFYNVRTNGSKVEVWKSGVLQAASADGVIAVNTWYVFELQARSVSSSTVRLRVNGTEVLSFFDGTGPGAGLVGFQFRNDADTAFTINTYTDGWYMVTGTTDNVNWQNDFRFGTWQNNQTSLTHKFGTNPSPGAWENANQTPGNESSTATWATNGNARGVTCSQFTTTDRTGPRNVSALSGLTFLGGATICRALANIDTAQSVKLRHGQQASGSETTANLATGVTFVPGAAMSTTRSFYTTFASDAAYDGTKWQQHGVDVSGIEEGSFVLAEIWSIGCYVGAFPSGPTRRVWTNGVVVTA